MIDANLLEESSHTSNLDAITATIPSEFERVQRRRADASIWPTETTKMTLEIGLNSQENTNEDFDSPEDSSSSDSESSEETTGESGDEESGDEGDDAGESGEADGGIESQIDGDFQCVLIF